MVLFVSVTVAFTRSVDSFRCALITLGDISLFDVAVVVVTLTSAVATVVIVLVESYFSLLITPLSPNKFPQVGVCLTVTVVPMTF